MPEHPGVQGRELTVSRTLISDRAYVLEKGQIRFEGSREELAANAQVRKDYLEV